MKHSYSNDDFLKRKSDAVSEDLSKSDQEPARVNKYDIGSQFEEFLQRRENGRFNQPSNECKCANCMNYHNYIALQNINQHKNKQCNNDFLISSDKPNFQHGDIMCRNLNKYNTPASPHTI